MKENNTRLRFVEQAPYLRRPRNPTCGEETARDNAEFLIPFKANFSNIIHDEQQKERDYHATLEHEENLAHRIKLNVDVVPNSGRKLEARLITNIAPVSSLKTRKEKVEEEAAKLY